MGELQELRNEIVHLRANFYALACALDDFTKRLNSHEKALEYINKAFGSPQIKFTKALWREEESETAA